MHQLTMDQLLLSNGSTHSLCSSLCSTLSLLGSGVGEAALLGIEEIRMLAAFAKQHMKKSHSVRLSDLDPSQWGCIRKNAGACREMQSTSYD